MARAARGAPRQPRPSTLYLARDLGLVAALYCAPEDLPGFGPPVPRAVPPRALGLSRRPDIPRRVLRGLGPPRGIARAPRPAQVERPPGAEAGEPAGWEGGEVGHGSVGRHAGL